MSDTFGVGTPVSAGDKVRQVGMFGLAEIPYPVFVQEITSKGTVIVGKELTGPPRTNLDGSVREYPPNVFVKLG